MVYRSSTGADGSDARSFHVYRFCLSDPVCASAGKQQCFAEVFPLLAVDLPRREMVSIENHFASHPVMSICARLKSGSNGGVPKSKPRGKPRRKKREPKK